MGRKKIKTGRCWLCGIEGKLSFEHIPPEKAFNGQRIFDDSVANILKNRNIRISQRGAGGYTLCERCNNNTGSWYGGVFVKFCKRAIDVLYQVDGSPTLCYEYKTYPLRVLKQIVTMFFSANGPEWQKIMS
jgi:hypothetical protein